MRRFNHFIPSLILLLILASFFHATLYAQNEITLEDLFVNYRYYPRRLPSFRWMKDGQHYTVLRENKVIKYDILTGKAVEELLDGALLDTTIFEGRIESYHFSSNEKKLLLTTGSEQIYRRSKRSFFYIFDLSTKTLQAVAPGKKIRYCTFDPSAEKVAYVYENNLFILDLSSGALTQITKDGKYNAIINGASDWVYEEEFGITRTFEWSPDSRYIAFMRFDETAVPEYTMMRYEDRSYPQYVTFKYPKVGAKNSIVTVHLYDLKTDKSMPLFTKDSTYEYIPRIKWTPDATSVCVFQMNRHQNMLQLFLYGVQGGRRLMLTESSPYYVDIHDNLTFLSEGRGFIWTSERDGYNHLYLYSMKGKIISQLTTGSNEVTKVYGLDENSGDLYYQIASEDGLDRYLMKVNIKTHRVSTLQDHKGNNSAQFSSTFDYYIYTFSDANTPPVYSVLQKNGRAVRVLEDNGRLLTALQGERLSPVRLLKVPGADGTLLNAAIIRPVDFDSSTQYPLLMYVYGGPGSQMVQNSYSSFGNYWWYQMLANEGYFIAIVDNRGTGGRGRTFKKMTYLQLGKYEIADQIHAAKYLGQRSYIDASRIGIWGWSYGGYMSSLAILKGNDVFKMAMAVAPVTNWKWYDSIYTERYMRTEEENPGGYHDNSPVYFADRLKGKYLIVHGLADDNVHFQNSAEMTKQLIAANKPYETLFYPNRNHGIYGDHARIHLFTKLTDFIHKNL